LLIVLGLIYGKMAFSKDVRLILPVNSNNDIVTLTGNFTDVETENALEVEDWMTNNNNWLVNQYFTLAANAVELETENALEVEGWMTSTNNWSINKYIILAANATEMETENALEIEGWMTNINTWKLNTPAYCQHPSIGEKTPSVVESELCMFCD
ncbi:hypothetical protein N9164_16530, partial [Draconibacterium sp.]|nr:hypothetical protein [Draconibacterium sp.]